MPRTVTVDVLLSFDAALEGIAEFMLLQDADYALMRFSALKEEVVRFINRVAEYPRIGRRFRPTIRLSDDELAKDATWVREALQNSGLPEAREYILHDHIVLYANSDTRVLVISIRHQRSEKYKPADL